MRFAVGTPGSATSGPPGQPSGAARAASGKRRTTLSGGVSPAVTAYHPVPSLVTAAGVM